MTSLCVYMDCLMTWAEPSLTAWQCRLKAMRKYLALFDLQKLTDQESYRSIIDELVKTLPQETKEQIVRSMRKHLDFVLSDNYRTPLRRRTMKSERPLPENFKYASEYVEELLKKKRAQPEMAPPAGIEPTVIYDKRNWKSRQQLRFIDSTLPVERLQEEVVRRGGSIDDLTDIHKHLNHLTSIAKVAIDKYTKEYLDPILDQIAAIARETGMTETHIIDYITAESSLDGGNGDCGPIPRPARCVERNAGPKYRRRFPPPGRRDSDTAIMAANQCG